MIDSILLPQNSPYGFQRRADIFISGLEHTLKKIIKHDEIRLPSKHLLKLQFFTASSVRAAEPRPHRNVQTVGSYEPRNEVALIIHLCCSADIGLGSAGPGRIRRYRQEKPRRPNNQLRLFSHCPVAN